MIAASELTISGRLAVALLESLDAAGSLPRDADLCLVYIVPDLDESELPAEIFLSGQRRWRLAQVEGDLALRVALCDAGGNPVVAFTSRHEESFQADLRERAVLRRTIRPQSRHIFSALVGIDATALDDERFGPPLHEILSGGRRDALLDAIRKRTWGQTVRESDAIAVMCAAAFGFDDRYTEERPGSLWAEWLRRPPPPSQTLTEFARELLGKRYPVYERVLASAPGGDPRELFVNAAGHEYVGDQLIVQLARDTALRMRETDPALLNELLAKAEAAYVAAGSPLIAAPLLQAAFLANSRRLAARCATPLPPSTAEIEALANNVFDEPEQRHGLIRVARLARGLLALEARDVPSDLDEFKNAFRDDVAWLDRAARRTREFAFSDPEIARTRDELVVRWYELRDRWNAAFASTLVAQWPGLFAFPGKEGPLVVSHLLKEVVRPGLASTKTLLVVLDGCDVPTFLEIMAAFSGVGVVATTVDLALSAIPTVTSHARRAIFGGDIPGDRIGDDDRAADANGDLKAFEGPNGYLDGFRRKLFLKGQLADGGEQLCATLRQPEPAFDLIGAVFNDVDDAIASKEDGVLPERTLERCSQAFRNGFVAAIESGWRVVITADHGHTPHRRPDRKASTGHTRFSLLEPSSAPPEQTVVFERGVGLPFRVAALHALGVHAGPQHLGYHGGVSIEEMFVPLATFEPKGARTPLLPPPWWDDAAAAVAPQRVVARETTRVAPVRAEASSRDRARAALGGDARLLKILATIEDCGFLSAAQLAAAAGLPAGRVRVFVTGLIGRLEAANIDPPISIEDDPLVFRWIGSK
jgi:hypothetical protein